MARKCELTGTQVQFGNNVPKSNKKTRRTFLPNVQSISFRSEILGQNVKLHLTSRTIRTVLKHGGLDNYLLTTKANHLTEFGLQLKHKLRKRAAATGVVKA